MKFLMNKYDLIRDICMHEKESSASNQINGMGKNAQKNNHAKDIYVYLTRYM